MILDSGSILRFLPINIVKRQFQIFDSLRFSLDIIDNNWIRLNKQLISYSTQKNNTVRNLPQLYSDVWSIIDNVQRFILLHSELHIKGQENLTKDIRYVKEFRNTFQHLNERIDEVLIDLDIPIYGILYWNYLNPRTQKVEAFITSSGISKYPLKFNYDFQKLDNLTDIDNIVFDTVIRRKSKFQRESLNLSLLITELVKVVKVFDSDLEIRFSELELRPVDWTKRKDILIKLINE